MVQTSCPAEPAILKASEHDYVGFAQAELEHHVGNVQTPRELGEDGRDDRHDPDQHQRAVN